MGPVSIHLVGSIPLDSAEAVFDLVASHLPAGCGSRIPDGETGERKNWIGWQLGVFSGQAALVQSGKKERDYQLHPPFTFAPGKSPADLDFRDLGFAREALTSFKLFSEKQRAGVLDAKARFLIAIPTPFAPVYSFSTQAVQETIYPLYEEAILAELGQICDALPQDKLAVQWDVATEMSIFENVYTTLFDSPWDVLTGQLAKLGDHVPAGVELGYHLCYGSMNNRHWKEPEDLGMCVRVSNALSQSVTRPVNFVHVPVPVDRNDDAYFAPLAGLDLDPGCELILGLVHDSDGVTGTRRRMRTASKYVDAYGIATECGLGRRKPEDMTAILALHAEIVEDGQNLCACSVDS